MPSMPIGITNAHELVTNIRELNIQTALNAAVKAAYTLSRRSRLQMQANTAILDRPPAGCLSLP